MQFHCLRTTSAPDLFRQYSRLICSTRAPRAKSPGSAHLQQSAEPAMAEPEASRCRCNFRKESVANLDFPQVVSSSCGLRLVKSQSVAEARSVDPLLSSAAYAALLKAIPTLTKLIKPSPQSLGPACTSGALTGKRRISQPASSLELLSDLYRGPAFLFPIHRMVRSETLSILYPEI